MIFGMTYDTIYPIQTKPSSYG